MQLMYSIFLPAALPWQGRLLSYTTLCPRFLDDYDPFSFIVLLKILQNPYTPTPLNRLGVPVFPDPQDPDRFSGERCTSNYWCSSLLSPWLFVILDPVDNTNTYFGVT